MLWKRFDILCAYYHLVKLDVIYWREEKLKQRERICEILNRINYKQELDTQINTSNLNTQDIYRYLVDKYILNIIHPYDKEELIKYAIEFLKESYEFLKEQLPDEDYIDVRLHLYNGNYNFLSGDSQYDTDHRGSFGYSSLIQDSEHDYEFLAKELVEEALDNYPFNEAF
jgi:hypothetical protein